MPMYNQNTTSPAHGQSICHPYCSCSVTTLSVLFMPSQNTICPHYFQLVHHIQSVHHLYHQCSVSIPYMYWPCSVIIPFLLPMYFQYTIYAAHVQLEYHPTAHVQAEYHLPCPCPVITPSVLPMSSQNTISLVHVLLVHLSCPHSVSIPSFLSMSSQNTMSTAHVQLEYYLSCPWLVMMTISTAHT